MVIDMTANTEVRYLVTAKPKAWTPFKKTWSWDRINGNWKRVRVKNFRRLYTDGRRVSLTPHPDMQSLETRSELAFVKKWAKRQGWDLDVQRKVIDLYPHLTGDTDCNADLLRALNAMAGDLGVKIHLASGRRTYDEQKALFVQNMIARGVPKPGRPLTAYPDEHAPHTLGIGADIWINGVNALSWSPDVRDVAVRNDVCFPVPGETWHAQLTKDTVGTEWAN